MQKFIDNLEKRILDGGVCTKEDALKLLEAEGPDLMSLFAAANRIRHEYCGDEVAFCGIVNAKSGACSENCSYCAQSAGHDTGVEVYSLLESDALVEASKESQRNGAGNFGIVTAWRGIKKGKQLDVICDAVSRIKAEGGVIPDVSLGLIEDPEVASQLYAAGVEYYHHNLETGPGFFHNVCTTHTFQDRVRTIKLCREAGMDICSGGLFGLGEKPIDRVELALAVRELGIQSTPLNFYVHSEGNSVPIQSFERLSAIEALKIIAMFRFVLPKNTLRVAGGREQTLGQLQPMIFFAGGNATMVGNYLTKTGRGIDADREMIEICGLKVGNKACGALA